MFDMSTNYIKKINNLSNDEIYEGLILKVVDNNEGKF